MSMGDQGGVGTPAGDAADASQPNHRQETPDASGGVPSDGVLSADGSAEESVVFLPSHRRRAEAFGIDILIAATVFGVALALDKLTGLSTLFLVLGAVAWWISYLGATVWLMDGQTAGKAICGLCVRGSRSSATPQSVRGVIWSLGRHSIGYLVVDVFLVGALLALVDGRRRCLHDYAFGSDVVQVRAADDVPASFAARYKRYWQQFADRYDALTKRNQWFFMPWKLLTKGLVVVWAVVELLPHKAEAAEGVTPAPAEAATPLSLKAAAGVWAATTVATGAIIAAIVPTPTPAVLDLAGTWQLSGVWTSNRDVYNPPRFEGARLVFVRENATFRIVEGPEFLNGKVISPERVDEREILARSVRTSRANCANAVSGALVAEDVYSVITTWEFMRTGSPGENDDQPERFEFHLVYVGKKDTDNPAAKTCPDHPKFEARATAVLLSRN